MIQLTDLPDDILEEIFHGMRDIMRFPGEPPYAPLQQEEIDTSSSAPPGNKPVPLWANVIALSHVCRHWRNLMLTRPHLWTFIRVTGSFSNRIMVNEMIERSNDFPLSILLTNNEHATNQDQAVYHLIGVTSVIGDHSERIRELGVVLRGERTALVLDSLSDCSLPRLEKLWLESEHYTAEPVSTFDITIPSLRSIHVHKVAISWLPCHDLTHLELTCGNSPPLPALLDMLRHSPLLQSLTLRTASFNTEEFNTVPNDVPAAVLPCLRRLQLQVDPAFDSAFSVLPHIVFPLSTAVRLSFTGPQSPTSLCQKCKSLKELARSVEHATFALDDTHAYLLSRSPRLNIDYEVADYELQQPGPARPGKPTARLCEGFLAVPLPALTSLSMSIFTAGGVVRLFHERFVRIFEATPSLQRLAVNVHPDDSVHVFTALVTTVKDKQWKKVALLPKLKEFVVTWQEEPSADDFWNLERCCHARASARTCERPGHKFAEPFSEPFSKRANQRQGSRPCHLPSRFGEPAPTRPLSSC